MPIHFVGKRDNAKRDRSPSTVLLSNAHSKRTLEHHDEYRSSACSHRDGGLLPDPPRDANTDEVFDPDLFNEIAEALGFYDFHIHSSGEPFSMTELAVHQQSTVSHVNVEPNGLLSHSNHT